MSQPQRHGPRSGKKMRMKIYPTKVGKILKIGKIKNKKARINLKKFARKKETRLRMLQLAHDRSSKKDVADNLQPDIDDIDFEVSEQEEERKNSDAVIDNVKTVDDMSVVDNLDESAFDSDSSTQIQAEARAEFHRLSDKSYLLILRHPGQLYFRGNLTVTPVCGVTSFLGYEFTPGMNPQVVYSPKGMSPLCFSTIGRNFQIMELPKISGLTKDILGRVGEKDSAVLIQPASGKHWVKLSGFFDRLLSFNPLAPSKVVAGKVDLNVEDDLGMNIFKPSDCNSSKSFYKESSEWDALFQEIWSFGERKGSMRVMVFGGKGVGKSTFIRFLVNQWLSSCNKSKSSGITSGAILFLDFDPGQSEFIPPGCMSVTLVSEPLLGPNYTHLKDPERMLCLGDLDVAKCPKWYLHCAADLAKFSTDEKYKDLPWFINTMGFCKGIGADLGLDLIRICRPTHVIQLTSIWSRRNFEPLNLLSWQMVMKGRGQKWNPVLSSKIDYNVPEYCYRQLKSLAEGPEKAGQSNKKDGGIEDIDSQWGLPAWQSRELCILAYFSKLVQEPEFNILDVVPKTLRLPDLVLSLPSAVVKPEYIKSVFNATIVVLCNLGKEYFECKEWEDGEEKGKKGLRKPWLHFQKRTDESNPKVLFHMPLAPCIGFGIVRGIDDSKGEIYVMTHLSNETMSAIDCLASGPRLGSIPAPLMMDSLKESKQKDVPYIAKKDRRTNLNRLAPKVFQSHLANAGFKQS